MHMKRNMNCDREDDRRKWMIKAAIIISIGFLIDGILFVKMVKLEKQVKQEQEE